MDSPDPLAESDGASGPSSPSQTNADGDDRADDVDRAKPTQARHRGRHAKDPLGQSVLFQCQRVEDLETKLRDYLANPTGDPEHTTLEFSFPVTAAFMVAAREAIPTKGPNRKVPYLYSPFNKTAISVIDALHTIKDPKEQMLMQKGISRALVEAVQQADGFRYSFHNHWISREDQASRFSYYCNDSTLNKGRAANEGASKVRLGVKIRKPVFDCHGLLSVKFSSTKMSLELHYKHVPLHQTYEERAPPPRKDSKRRKILEIFHPDKLPKPKEKKRKAAPPSRQSPARKRRATEPLPQPESGSRPETARENSLQPLFDFLGSAGRLDEDRPTTAASETTGDITTRNAESEPPLTGGGGINQSRDESTSEVSSRRPPKKMPFPGMMSGFMAGEEITWGRKTAVRRAQRSKRSEITVPVSTAENTSTDAQVPEANTQQTAPNPLTELEALKARLQEAEQKIRDLEAEKNRAVAPIVWNGPPPQPPASSPGFAHPHYPAPYYPYRPPQWQNPPPPAAPPNPHAAPTAARYPGPVPASVSGPASDASQPPKTGPNQAPAQTPAPAYGFIPNPADSAANQATPTPTAPQPKPQKALRWQNPRTVANVADRKPSLQGFHD
ncbi:uncharacterized protein Z518_02784 [Rhinocladiella mackenziei CBS 650.93]|uniref:Rhinocladiella mackenziei CBS 650.93 unplaced genomic scaffold supercont1.2, whole genome shotgun sequence n=1 Tax=Rhinocladiella mackenziei CBS 650.93 TaxID=1442369 RepID=A0A0D2HCG1_9EURO|nr:uncharacterized protein Z518_02784 [Rhinocladiella mackenziei CBS 650.93]KIX08128.1 hypothetical protein Z518_02784 [Rhinocladiella mackenziei CBS 650.93]